MNLLEKENKKREKIKEMGLDFDFPGFVKYFFIFFIYFLLECLVEFK